MTNGTGLEPDAVGLDEVTVTDAVSVGDQIAFGEFELRKETAKRILQIFGAVNVAVLIGLAFAFGFDVSLLRGGVITPADRLITGEVIMALLGATTVQLGAIMYTIARYLFPVGE